MLTATDAAFTSKGNEGSISPSAVADLLEKYHAIAFYAEKEGDQELQAMIHQMTGPVQYMADRTGIHESRIPRSRLQENRRRLIEEEHRRLDAAFPVADITDAADENPESDGVT
jgi:hypothetical protein